jgi:hypothetical protein
MNRCLSRSRLVTFVVTKTILPGNTLRKRFKYPQKVKNKTMHDLYCGNAQNIFWSPIWMTVSTTPTPHADPAVLQTLLELPREPHLAPHLNVLCFGPYHYCKKQLVLQQCHAKPAKPAN